MRKLLLGMVVLVSLLFIGLSAQAETYVLDELMATVEIPDTYTVVTPDTISSNSDWLAGKGISSEDLANDMLRRGALLIAWDQEDDSRQFEITATQDEQTKLVFDVNEQTNDYRRNYRTSFSPQNDYTALGYTFSSSNWKHADNGRFLILEYIMRQYGDIDHRGYMRRTIRNGYEITLDMQVYGRRLTTKDNTALNKIWNTFTFVEILPLPAAAEAKINIADIPPRETNNPEFAITGTAAEGVKFTSVLMWLNSSEKILTETEVGRDGKLSIPISLPREGVFMITITAEYNGETVAELAYPVTYQRTLLPVNILSTVPESVTSDTLTIQGTAEPRADIQVFVNEELYVKKKVTAEGRFLIEIDTADEGPYNVIMSFSKKDLADRRITLSFTRNWSTEDMIARIKSDAVSPNYNTLIGNIARYDNRTISYKAYLVDVTQSGDDWIYRMALSKSNGSYSNYILVVAPEEPKYDVGTRLMMYGTSVGMSVPSQEGTNEDGDPIVGDSYPCFELLLLTSIE